MAGSKKSEKQLESKERQLATSCAATHHGHWTVQIFFGQTFLHFATFLLQIEHLCQMESVKDERMKALWRPFCAGEVRRDKPAMPPLLSTLLVLPQLPRFRPESSLPVPSGTAGTGSGGGGGKNFTFCTHGPWCGGWAAECGSIDGAGVPLCKLAARAATG